MIFRNDRIIGTEMSLELTVSRCGKVGTSMSGCQTCEWLWFFLVIFPIRDWEVLISKELDKIIWNGNQLYTPNTRLFVGVGKDHCI